MLNRNGKLPKSVQISDLPYCHSAAISYYQEVSSAYTNRLSRIAYS